MPEQTINASSAIMTLNTPNNNHRSEWTCVSWFNKISDAVASKTCRFFGYAVATVVSVITFIPSLVVDFGYAVKSLYDRKITQPQTTVQNRIPLNTLRTPTSKQASANCWPTSAQSQTVGSSIQTDNMALQTGVFTTKSENTVKSQKWPLSDNLGSTLAPQKPLRNESFNISENSTQQILSPNLPVIPEAKVQWRRYIHDDDVKATMQSYDQFFAANVKYHPREIPNEAYNKFWEIRAGKVPIDLITQDGTKTITLKKKFGGGGSKDFYDIGNDYALAIIKGSHQAYDELMMHRYLEKLGVPTNEIKPAVIRWESEGVEYTEATYIAPSFSSYASQNTFVLDHKNNPETANRLGGKKVLSADQDPFRLENWDDILNPLVHDVRTLVDNGVSLPGDAQNAIITGKGTKFHTGSIANYEARAFPFDFSSKRHELDQLPQKEQLSIEEERITLKEYIWQIVWVQYDVNAFSHKEWNTLVDQLTERYLRRRS